MNDDPVVEEYIWLLTQARAARLRSLAEWVEAEVVIPDGEYRDQRFRLDRQPWARLLYGEIDSGAWVEHFITGPSQSGKSLAGYVIPALYHLAEVGETIVLGVPDMRMADNKWKIDFLPVFRASPRLEQLLPTSGPGSRGGTVKDTITLTNGAVVKFAAAGGHDETRAGFTARVVSVTELKRFSEGAEKSVEADPLRQLQARQQSFELRRRRTYAEGTLGTTEQLPWTARAHSSRSRIACPCVHCREYVSPGRNDLQGWDGAANEFEAEERTSWFCPKCGESIGEDARREMNVAAKLVHDGQTVDKKGRVRGEPPKTRRLWFHYTAFNNLFVSAAEIGALEWKARQLEEGTADRESSEKELCQIKHGIPYTPPQLDETRLDAKVIRTRTAGDALPQGRIPADTQKLTLFIDPGKYKTWWLLLSCQPSKLHIPDYGMIKVVREEGEDAELRLLAVLRELRERIEIGWPIEGSAENRVPDQVWIDRGHWGHIVYAFCRESGARYLPTLGRGLSLREKSRYQHPRSKTSEVRQLDIDGRWHIRKDLRAGLFYGIFDADYFKRWIQERLTTKLGDHGSLSLYAGDGGSHVRIANHFANETLKRKKVPGKGEQEYWHRTGDNHLLDCGAGAAAAAFCCGWRFIPSGIAPRKAGSWFSRGRRSG